MNKILERFSLAAVMLLAVGSALLMALVLELTYQVSQAHLEMERGAREQATAALDMLESVHTSAMLLRSQTGDNDPAIDTLNMSMVQFSDQNQNIKLWLVMGKPVLDYQLANNQTEIEGPLDDIDSRALQERTSQQEFTEHGTLRVTRPVILGVGSADDARCAGCHTALMGIADREVIGAYSAEVNMAAPIAAWRASAMNSTLAGLLSTFLTLGLILFLLRRTVLIPITRLANVADQIAGGIADVEFSGAKRGDSLGVLARSLNAFKLKARDQLDLEVEIARKNEALRKADELQNARDQLERVAYFDDLTGLANRAHCKNDMAEQFAIADIANGFAIIQIDIDNFKRVNDTSGHAAGDHLLRELGGRLNMLAQATDGFKAYRWGGDEFIAIIKQQKNKDLDAICQELNDLIGVPVVFEKSILRPTGSMGVSRYPEDAQDIDALMIFSDLALYRAKELGRDGYHFFTSKMKEKIDAEAEIEKGLRIAIEQGQLELYYQPQISTVDESVTGLEGLLRWNHPEQGLLAPGQFLSVAETTGLAPAIGRRVFDIAMQSIRSWVDDGVEFNRLAINLSPEHLKQGSVVNDLVGAMDEHGVEPRFLSLEFLESFLLDDPNTNVRNILEQLRERNIRVELDDFGTGYASLSHLATMPIDGLKIDRSFVTQMVRDQKQNGIVSSLISMTKLMGLGVVCEGVETQQQLEAVARIGDCSIQGYLIAKPMSFEDITNWILAERNIGIFNTIPDTAMTERKSGPRSV